MTSSTPRATLAPSVADATAITPVSVGPRHGVQPSANTAPEQRRTGDRRQLPRREPGIPLQQRDEADEHQTHQDRDHAADALQQKLIGDQRARHAEHRDGAEHEHRGEARHEQQRRTRHPDPGARAATVTAPDGSTRVLDADDRGQVGQIAGHQRHHARRGERHQPGEQQLTSAASTTGPLAINSSTRPRVMSAKRVRRPAAARPVAGPRPAVPAGTPPPPGARGPARSSTG